ncbi:hypothetical protein K491DRAFT_657774 [Lophiostoma macrostomum CBS 122681]|uniref:Uncharacterized protein n=1 Tax=Lophiostoma macrostomum CBS 122681 TaxID=1314788 RepID=A0A6A6TB61_9PLEO|nr:hypothetical protein K491DRAFT_657774 [Lophiostoma macrostomum CBS 122681]
MPATNPNPGQRLREPAGGASTVNPTASGEISITVKKPLKGTATYTAQITGSPNRSGNIVVTEKSSEGAQTQKQGALKGDDVSTLAALIEDLVSYPSSDSEDIYGLDTELSLANPEVQWSNGEADTSGTVREITDESKETFKEAVDTILGLVRRHAKQDRAL